MDSSQVIKHFVFLIVSGLHAWVRQQYIARRTKMLWRFKDWLTAENRLNFFLFIKKTVNKCYARFQGVSLTPVKLYRTTEQPLKKEKSESEWGTIIDLYKWQLQFSVTASLCLSVASLLWINTFHLVTRETEESEFQTSVFF